MLCEAGERERDATNWESIVWFITSPVIRDICQRRRRVTRCAQYGRSATDGAAYSFRSPISSPPTTPQVYIPTRVSLSTISTTSICCGFVEQKVAQQIVHHIHKLLSTVGCRALISCRCCMYVERFTFAHYLSSPLSGVERIWCEEGHEIKRK